MHDLSFDSYEDQKQKDRPYSIGNDSDRFRLPRCEIDDSNDDFDDDDTIISYRGIINDSNDNASLQTTISRTACATNDSITHQVQQSASRPLEFSTTMSMIDWLEHMTNEFPAVVTFDQWKNLIQSSMLSASSRSDCPSEISAKEVIAAIMNARSDNFISLEFEEDGPSLQDIAALLKCKKRGRLSNGFSHQYVVDSELSLLVVGVVKFVAMTLQLFPDAFRCIQDFVDLLYSKTGDYSRCVFVA